MTKITAVVLTIRLFFQDILDFNDSTAITENNGKFILNDFCYIFFSFSHSLNFEIVLYYS